MMPDPSPETSLTPRCALLEQCFRTYHGGIYKSKAWKQLAIQMEAELLNAIGSLAHAQREIARLEALNKGMETDKAICDLFEIAKPGFRQKMLKRAKQLL